jgi:uncharacterized protein YkwD
MTPILLTILSFFSINSERIEHGLHPLRIDQRLVVYATNHAATMGSEGRLRHSRTLSDLLPGTGGVGENVGVCWKCDVVPVSAYMESPAHRDNILNPRWTTFGTGTAVGSDGSTYDVQIFAEDPSVPVLPRFAILTTTEEGSP